MTAVMIANKRVRNRVKSFEIYFQFTEICNIQLGVLHKQVIFLVTYKGSFGF